MNDDLEVYIAAGLDVPTAIVASESVGETPTRLEKTMERDSVAAIVIFGAAMLGCVLGLLYPGLTSCQKATNDDQRLEWRSQNNLPPTDEDIRYEQQKILKAAQQIKDSERPN